MSEYRISSRSGSCAATGKAFEPGDRIISAIYADPSDGFVRRDYSEEGFPGDEGAFSVWRGLASEDPAQAQRLDFELAQAFLERLLEQADPACEGLIYTLVLLLSRKRRVKIIETRPLPDGELLTVRLRGQEQDRELPIRAPRLGEQDVTRLQAELAGLFGFEQADSETAAEPPPP